MYNNRLHTLIIGGTRGIGHALVRALAEDNHVLSVIGRRPPSMEIEVIPNVNYYYLDITNKVRLSAILNKILSKSGKINNLIFFQRFRGKGDDWEGEIQTSLTATRNIIEKLANQFDGRRGKSIVIINSIACNFIVQEQKVSYHVAKAGLSQMVRYYAVLLGPSGIRVNSISPATVLKEESRDFYLKNIRLQNLYKKITPLQRMGTSEDICHAVMFLCSQKASFITGQNLIVDGGISLQWHETLARKLSFLSNLKVTRARNHSFK